MSEGVRIGGLRYGLYDEGPGPRTVIWFAGCPLACPACINPQLWPADSGELVSLDEAGRRLLAGRAHGDRGVTFVGGEPMAQPEALAALCALIRREWPPTSGLPLIILYSGYTLEALRARRSSAVEAALAAADVLVDGPFVAALAADTLGYRGSRNQRVIDLSATLRAGRVVTLDWDRPRITLSRGRIVTTPALARRLNLPVTPARHCGQATG